MSHEPTRVRGNGRAGEGVGGGGGEEATESKHIAIGSAAYRACPRCWDSIQQCRPVCLPARLISCAAFGKPRHKPRVAGTLASSLPGRADRRLSDAAERTGGVLLHAFFFMDTTLPVDESPERLKLIEGGPKAVESLLRPNMAHIDIRSFQVPRLSYCGRQRPSTVTCYTRRAACPVVFCTEKGRCFVLWVGGPSAPLVETETPRDR